VIPSLPRPWAQRVGLNGFMLGFFVFLFVPLLVVAVFAFNDAAYPAPPWMGFTLDWFTADNDTRIGFFHDSDLLGSLGTSAWVALWVTLLSVGVGTCNAFLLERFEFPGKNAVALLAMLPLVIPGVILGISILAFASRIANFAYDTWEIELEFLRPGLPLVILGQFCYIVTIATLTISASLRRFDRTLEEAALNLGASRAAVLWTITLPYLRPSMIGAGAMAFLMSFENFNTTLMLVGSDSPLTVLMYSRMREGATPALNAVSLFLMVASAMLALLLLWRGGAQRTPAGH
jgi:spermidine/putrescine transport system permease protein